MTRQRFVGFALSFAVAGLPLASAAWAQERTSNGNTTGTAVPRSDGGGGGSAAPRGGDSGGSSGGGSSSSGGGVSSSGWSAPSNPTPASSNWSTADAPRRSEDQATRSRGGGSSTTGTATTRSGSSSSPRSGSGSSGGSASGRSASAGSGSDSSGPSRRAVPTYSRPRGDRPVTGEAVERGSVPGGGGGGGIIHYPYYPWGFWGPGYGFGLGYLYYDPWFGGYGYGYGDPYYGGGGGGGGYALSGSSRETGSLRLKINPKQAQIFVDGYLVGIVDSYDGSFQKLSLEGGGHKVELKAEGYEPIEFEVLVTPGETVTYKGEMKRIK